MFEELTREELIKKIQELQQQIDSLSDKLQNSGMDVNEWDVWVRNHLDLLDKIKVVSFTITGDGVIQNASRAIETIIGYAPEELTGRLFEEFIFPDDRSLIRSAFLNVLDGGIQASEYRVVTKDGNWRWVRSLSHRLMKDGTLKGIQGVLQDVSDRKEAEESYHVSESRYRNIVETIREGYFEVDLHGNFTFVNQAICTALGHNREQLIGTNYKDYASAETADRMFQIFGHVFESGEDGEIESFEIVTRDEKKILVELAASNIYRDDGRIEGFRAIVRDITGRTVAEKEREKLENQLHQAQKMEAIGTLAGGIAHDFNNILMGIQGNISLMLLNMPQTHPNHEKLKNIENYIQGGSGLTRQLLTFARRERYEVKTTNLNDLLEQTVRMFGRTKKEIHIHSKYEPDLLSVDVDQGQISQVLLNLFVNAWQAMPDGGHLYLQTDNVELDENQVKGFNLMTGTYVKMSITDTGIGMKESVRQRIFDPFFTTKEMGRGTGLGLASAYGIVKNHEGMITVYSEEGEGTTFNVYLPASGKDVSVKQKESDQILTGSETILFVDDEVMIMNLGQEILETLGYTVLTVRSGEEALHVYKENINDISLVILDMIMPDMNGGEAFDRLREINPEIKVLLSSGYSANGQAGEIISRGCSGFIQKPFNLIALSRKIREILDE